MLRTVARRVFSSLPAGPQRSIKRALAPLTYDRYTRGLSVPAPTIEWVRANPRPVSIVIPSYNDFPYLTACLASIEATCAGFDYEVIIVDDYCQEANSARLRTLESEKVRVVFKPARLGFAGTVNRGMTEARYDVVLLNSDIVAKTGWLEALQHAAYAIDEKIGMVSPKLVYPNGVIQYGGTYYARVLAPQWFGHLFVGSPATRPLANVGTYNRSVSGACVYITRKALDTVGLLDDTFWLGFEDVDYGLKAWELGVRCYYEPAALLVHHESASRGYSQGWRELESMRHFWRRWTHLFLSRRIEGVPAVDLVISSASPALWREYVGELAQRLESVGHVVAIHESDNKRDERVIGLLAERESIKVACDWGVSETVWLASLEHGKPVHLLPAVESDQFPDDPALQMSIIAHYKPEFDYIAPTRAVADSLRGQTAWEVRARIVPVLKPRATTAEVAGIATLGASAVVRKRLDALATELGTTVAHLDGSEPTSDVVDELVRLSPRAVVALGDSSNSLAVLRLMSIGAGLVSEPNDRLRYELLDGYNALLAAPGDSDAIARAVTDILTNDAVWQGISSNGLATAERLYAVGTDETSRALRTIAENAV